MGVEQRAGVVPGGGGGAGGLGGAEYGVFRGESVADDECGDVSE